MKKPDSIIFDMDGTLWDAVDTYAESWNIIFRQLDIDIHVDRNELAKMVGWEGKKVHAVIMPDFDDDKRQSIYAKVNELRRELLPKNGGVLYEGVKDGLQK